MHRVLRVFYYWAPPLIWMGLIFYMSSQKSISITTNAVSEFVTFKTLHMVEYSFLFFLLYRAFQSLKIIQNNMFAIYSFIIACSYSFTDELHQLSIPSRQGRVRDILFDVAGMMVMYGIIKKVRLIQKLL